jgi:AcrR family transcriptional regulator
LRDKRSDIKTSGGELFSSKGFKDTNVSDITNLAGVAVGTFYNYYSSKESLFLELFLEENVKLKKRIMESIDLKGDPLDVMKELMYRNLSGMNSNPILREWYNRGVFSKIERHYREENGIEHVDFLSDTFAGIITEWQAEGKIRDDIDGNMIIAMFTALINIETHKEEIGIQYFPKIMDYLAEFIMLGLTDCRTSERPWLGSEKPNASSRPRRSG